MSQSYEIYSYNTTTIGITTKRRLWQKEVTDTANIVNCHVASSIILDAQICQFINEHYPNITNVTLTSRSFIGILPTNVDCLQIIDIFNNVGIDDDTNMDDVIEKCSKFSFNKLSFSTDNCVHYYLTSEQIQKATNCTRHLMLYNFRYTEHKQIVLNTNCKVSIVVFDNFNCLPLM